MTKFFTLLGREVKSFFYSPIAYVVMCFFLFLTGFAFYIGVSLLNRGPTEMTVVEAFFNTILFWIAYLLIFPLITMRSFSEEFKLGTIEGLMTAPVQDWQVVVTKWLGCLIFYIILWMPTIIYFWVFSWAAKAQAAHSPGAYFGSYLLLLLMGMFYCSVGCFASVLTKNQIVAAIISLVMILVLPLCRPSAICHAGCLRDDAGCVWLISRRLNICRRFRKVSSIPGPSSGI